MSRIAVATDTPRQNGLLAALPREDYDRLLPHLRRIALPVGSVLHHPGERESGVYFLASGLVSCLNVTREGASAEFALVGREGMIGVASFLGGHSTPSEAVVLRAGFAYRLAADDLARELDRGGALTRLLLRYVQALIAQTGQTAACNRHHSVEQQLCRWILSCLDRLASNELMVTQGLIARLLGVRRQGVGQGVAHLERAGIIRYRRGRMAVLDRPRLESRVCECYAVVRREFDRLLPGFGQPIVGFEPRGRTGCDFD